MELTGFEPVTPSLRKMRSKPSDQEFYSRSKGLWSDCGASDVRRSEMSGRVSRAAGHLALGPVDSDGLRRRAELHD